MLLARECDARSCGRGSHDCANTSCQHQGRQVKINVAKSTVAGWGVFAKCDLAKVVLNNVFKAYKESHYELTLFAKTNTRRTPNLKDEFVGDYVGEIISNEESERRGAVYDADGISFLFAIGANHCLDATRIGLSF